VAQSLGTRSASQIPLVVATLLLLKNALTDNINDRALFMKGIDVSYYYEGYSEFKINEL